MNNHDGGDGLSGRRVNTVPAEKRPGDSVKRKTRRGYHPKYRERKPEDASTKAAELAAKDERIRELIQKRRPIEFVSSVGNRYRLRPVGSTKWITDLVDFTGRAFNIETNRISDKAVIAELRDAESFGERKP